MHCIPHVINLVVQDGLKKSSEVVDEVKGLINYFRRSNTALSQLKDYCAVTKEDFHIPQQDVVTRWNSTLSMLRSMIPMKEAIDKMRLTTLPCPSPQEWNKVQSLADFLEPFEDATKMLSGSSYCTLSQASFLMTALKDHMTKNLSTSDFGVKDMLAKAAKYAQDLETQSLLPTFLDPRYYEAMTATNRKTAINTLKTLLSKDTTVTTIKPKKITIFDEAYADFELDDTLTKGFPELTKYVNLSKTGRSADPLLWWRVNEAEMPHLAAIAREHLGMLASSVPCEEAFSAAAQPKKSAEKVLKKC